MPKPKINLFALPSQTAMLFWLLTATLLGMILLGSIDPNPVPIIGLLPLTVILLSLRGFLERPDREIRKKCLQSVGERFPLLRKAIEEDAYLINLKRIPQLLIDEKRNEIYEMGSFTRWYIVCGVEKAQILENWLATPESNRGAQGILLHELHHFKTGDYWQLGYLSELFQATFRLMFWILGFFGGWIFLLALIGSSVLQMSPDSILKKIPEEDRPLYEQIVPSMFPPETQRQALQEKAAEIDLGAVLMFIVSLSFYVIFIAIVLWRFYRLRLWQMREFYADSGMAQSMGTMAPVWDVFKLNRVSNKASINPSQSWVTTHFLDAIANIYNQRLRNVIEGTNFWPPFDQRTNALASPQNVFYDWKKTAWLLGSLMLLLEIFLDSPYNIPYVGDNPISLVTLMFVMAIAYFLLPHILMGKSAWWQGLLIVAIVNFIRMVWLTFSLIFLWGLYWLDPNTLLGSLYYEITSAARYAGTETFEVNVLDFLEKATTVNFLQLPVIFIIQAISVLTLFFFFQRIASWYSFFTANKTFRRVVLGLTLWILFVLYSTILPLGNRIFGSDLLEPLNIFMAILGILVGVAGGIWFIIQDRRYYQKCPACHEKAVVSNFVGAACPSCSKTLYSWLVVNYEDE